MKIVNLNSLENAKRNDGVFLKTALNSANTGLENITMGHGIFPKGVVSPVEGTTAHDADEYSYVVSGQVFCECDGKEYLMKPGDFGFIPKGVSHKSYNTFDEPAELIWILVK